MDVLKSLTERALRVCEDFDDLDDYSIGPVVERAVSSTIEAVDIMGRGDARIAAQHELVCRQVVPNVFTNPT